MFVSLLVCSGGQLTNRKRERVRAKEGGRNVRYFQGPFKGTFVGHFETHKNEPKVCFPVNFGKGLCLVMMCEVVIDGEWGFGGKDDAWGDEKENGQNWPLIVNEQDLKNT